MDFRQYMQDREGVKQYEEGLSPQFRDNRRDFMLRHNSGYKQTSIDGVPATYMLDMTPATPQNIAGSTTRYNQLQNYPNTMPAPNIDDYVGASGMMDYMDAVEQRKNGRPSNLQDVMSLDDLLYRYFADQYGDY